jgi:hypothetical protein
MKKETLDWLCRADNPPARYLTLKNLLDRPESTLRKERAALNDYTVVKGILKHHKTFWGKRLRLYQKYKGGYWQLIFLGDLFADGRNTIIRDGCEFILNDRKWRPVLDAKKTDWICLAANITRALANLGYADDPRVLTLTEDIARAIVNNNGINCTIMDYSLLPQCYMALPKVLMALGSYVGTKRIIKQAIKIASEKLLERNIYCYVPQMQDQWNSHYEKTSRELRETRSYVASMKYLKDELAKARPKMLKKNKGFKPKAGWLNFGYPLHYNSDILEAMRSMADAGVKYDRRMDDALGVIEKNMLPDGRWKLAFSLNGRMWVDIERRGQPSKWVTYHALRVLRTYGRSV